MNLSHMSSSNFHDLYFGNYLLLRILKVFIKKRNIYYNYCQARDFVSNILRILGVDFSGQS